MPLPVQPAALDTVSSERFGLNASEGDWESLLPPGEGFFYDPETDVQYLVSQYHQVHCLRAFRTYFNRVNAPNTTLTPKEYGHISHCLQYSSCSVFIRALHNVLMGSSAPDGDVFGGYHARTCIAQAVVRRWTGRQHRNWSWCAMCHSRLLRACPNVSARHYSQMQGLGSDLALC